NPLFTGCSLPLTSGTSLAHSESATIKDVCSRCAARPERLTYGLRFQCGAAVLSVTQTLGGKRIMSKKSLSPVLSFLLAVLFIQPALPQTAGPAADQQKV